MMWVPVVGWEGRYEVSDAGLVRSVARTVQRKSKTGTPSFYPMKCRTLVPVYDRTGYTRTTFTIGHGGRVREAKVYTHRVVLEAFVGPCPDGMECRHLNGIRDDNRLENLAWGDYFENCADRAWHAEHPGEARP